MAKDPNQLPDMIYGTAWKEDETAALVRLALDAGFRAIDTANQRKHYHEAGVGEGIAAFLAEHGREALFIQSKFTSLGGQDDRLPYERGASPERQVFQSFERSLTHLGLSWLDSLLLHGPDQHEGLSANDWAVWRAMETLHAEGRTRVIGVSNMSASQLQTLIDGARVCPAFVQNRCYASQRWGADVRAVAARHGVVYQGFSLLTANRGLWGHKKLATIARELRTTPAAVIFRYVRTLGILPLTGTTDPAHMRIDLGARTLVLTEAQQAEISGLT